MIELPIDSFLPQIIDALRQHRALVLVAEPGAGKTTRVPPAILRAGLLNVANPNLVMLQPRRLATRAAAARIAEENGWALGDEVGYQVRFEKRITARTRLRVITEAILTRQLLDDPSLEGVGCVVLDEFHERSVHTDLAIALLNEVKQSLRDDLMLVVMSATLDADPVAAFLGGAPIIHVPGRVFPVEITHRARGGEYLEETIADVVMQQPDDGHVLVFLPGTEEIRRAEEAIRAIAPGRDVLPLHGSLSFEDQQRAIAPSRRQKIILSTNIAETSLTIDGVRTVIDSGLARRPSFDPQRGLDSLNLDRISNASAVQRAGRAGRTAAGRCVRLWTQQEHALLEAFDAPEIARIDLAPTLLDLHAWGQSDVTKFGWYESPPTGAISSAETLLRMLGALDAEGKITPLGKRLQRMPVHPRLARLLIEAADAGAPMLGANVAAILSEKDFVFRSRLDRNAIGSTQTTSTSDVIVRLHLLEDAERGNFAKSRIPDNVDAFAARQVARVRDQLARMMDARSSRENVTDDLVRRLVLLAYPDRVCRRRNDVRTGTMVRGVGVRLDQDCSVLSGDYFVAVDPRQDDRARAREAYVRIASSIEPQWLEELFPQSCARTQEASYDDARDRVVVRAQTMYLDLVLREDVDAQAKGADAGDILAAALRPRLKELIEANESLTALLARVRLLRRHMPELHIPDLDSLFTDQSGDNLLLEAARGKTSKQQVQRALYDVTRSRLIYPHDRLLEEHAPEAIIVPTGSSIKLAYNPDPAKAPVLAVRLQEMFGLTTTPRVAGGRVAVLLHLLGPNYRPVQITQDLASFWKNTYAQVRKDLRADYPKHSWPDDPLTAPAVRGARRRR
ncbi:MAG: ATP-dependent helicase HrpB [Burkholderiales bacterium]|nr:ATP-dependent helicase HrpB [Phycisphaerae bacterium]